MKCLKNKKTEEIIRVDDKQAHQMVGITWSYVPKKEWKAVTRAEVLSEEEKQEKEQKLSTKATRRSKFKEKLLS